MPASVPNVIERSVTIARPRARVWQALTTAAEFSRWFGAQTAEEFAAGRRVHMVSTHPGYEGVKWFIDIVEMTPEERFVWLWHPGSKEPAADEPTTRVEFRLEEVDGGTRVTITESGFDLIPAERRARVFEENSGGWDHQVRSFSTYVSSQ